MSDPNIEHPAKAKWNYKEYLIQVSLIIVSVLVALGLDRCNQNIQDEKQLNEFITLIHKELNEEMAQNANNLNDCANDVRDLEYALAHLSSNQDSVLEMAFSRTLLVLARGVFRAFPPLTYERMVASGEISLIKSIAIKDRLAAYSAFRQNYLQYDLKEFDKSTLEVLGKVGPYFDLACATQKRGKGLLSCIHDKEAIRKNTPGILGKLYRQASLRSFHLEQAQALLKETLSILEKEADMSFVKE